MSKGLLTLARYERKVKGQILLSSVMFLLVSVFAPSILSWLTIPMMVAIITLMISLGMQLTQISELRKEKYV